MVVEVADARLPFTSRHARLPDLVKEKPRVLVLSRRDLADPALTGDWEAYYRSQGERVFATSLRRRGEARRILTAIESWWSHSPSSPLLFVVVAGLPNVGKSFLINQWIGQARLPVGNRPGVTRAPRWVRVGQRLAVLDTPGVFEPRPRRSEERLALACTGILPEGKYDPEEAATWLVGRLAAHPAGRRALAERWHQQESSPSSRTPCTSEVLGELARARGFWRPGGVADLRRTAEVLLAEFRRGELGRITLELPPSMSSPVVRNSVE